MKKIITVVLMLAFYCNTQAQNSDTVPLYKKIHTIPYFQLLQGDSTWFKSTEIPKNKPVVIIYFSPDCGHCQLTAQEFVRDMDKIKNVFLVWVSYHKPDEIKSFSETYKLNQFSNVKLGRDTTYYIPGFYQVKFTPFMAVYNKQGKLLQAFEGGTNAETIAKLVND